MIATGYQQHEWKVLGAFSLVIAAALAYLAFISPGIEGGMDSYNHYLIAKNTWNHPYLFLDQWGKPLYNIIASAFAQFGLYGVTIFNIICLVGSAYLAFRISKKLGILFPFLAFVLTILSPVFLDNTISALTEPFCALLVTLTIYLLIYKRYILAAILAGFLPFARSEGFIILGIVIIYLLYVQEYKVTLYVLIGSLFFNTLGWIIEGEPFWIITQNPYINYALSGKNVCGHGSLSHFLYAGHYTFGQLTSIGLVASAAIISWQVFKKGLRNNLNIVFIFIVMASYFGAHVILWWLGEMGSCGYVRVMAVISPTVAVLVAYAFSQMSILLARKGIHTSIVKVFLGLIILNTMYTPYRYYAYKYPLTISAEQEQYVQLNKWYAKEDLKARTKVFLYPYFNLIADIDPYDKKKHLEFWASSFQFTKKGDILIWDSHFGPNECGTPLKSLEENVAWKKIYSLIPSDKITTVNDVSFEIHVFEKIH
jgi:hypothetical protein